METLDTAMFLSIAGVGAIITALVEAFKRAAGWSEEMTARFAPLVSIALGIVIFGASTLLLPLTEATMGEAFFGAVLTGIIAGATASGIYAVGGKQVIRAVAGEPPAGG